MEGQDKNSGKLTKQQLEQIQQQYQKILDEKKSLMIKSAELEAEYSEHQIVIDTLKSIKDDKRKCFRMVGGVLVESIVKDVLPALENNANGINKILETLKTRTEAKVREELEFREKHRIQSAAASGAKVQQPEAETTERKGAASSGSSGVLVS